MLAPTICRLHSGESAAPRQNHDSSRSSSQAVTLDVVPIGEVDFRRRDVPPVDLPDVSELSALSGLVQITLPYHD